jgi:GR25 family glycosyltransferase involved in LPS biosynthesis
MEGKIHIYCINLKHRVDRWERFSSQPELGRLKALYGFERFEGINGSAIDIKKDERISLRTKRNIKEHTRRDHEELDSAGGVGCYLSHTTVWKKFLEREEPYAIVFEDDAVILPGFTENLHMAMKDVTLLPDQPDIWSFSWVHEYYYDSKGRPMPNAVKDNVYGPWTTNVCTTFTGYLISKRGAQRLLENAFPIDMHVDMYACLNSELGKVLSVKHAAVKTPAYSLKEHDTDIQVSEDCPICNVPTKYREKGIVLLNLPVVVIGLSVIAGLYILGRGSSARR